LEILELLSKDRRFCKEIYAAGPCHQNSVFGSSRVYEYHLRIPAAPKLA